jgi:hypothetical protein
VLLFHSRLACLHGSKIALRLPFWIARLCEKLELEAQIGIARSAELTGHQQTVGNRDNKYNKYNQALPRISCDPLTGCHGAPRAGFVALRGYEGAAVSQKGHTTAIAGQCAGQVMIIMCSEVTARLRTARQSHCPVNSSHELMFAKGVSESLIRQNHPPICQGGEHLSRLILAVIVGYELAGNPSISATTRATLMLPTLHLEIR